MATFPNILFLFSDQHLPELLQLTGFDKPSSGDPAPGRRGE